MRDLSLFMASLGKKLKNYFFAEDIYQGYNYNENLIREFNTESDKSEEFNSLLQNNKKMKNLSVLLCSAVPNIMGCIGISAFLFDAYTLLPYVAIGFGEYLRKDLRNDAKDYLSALQRTYPYELREIESAQNLKAIREGFNKDDDEFDGADFWKKL